MARPNRTNLNLSATGAGVGWNCRKCGKTGLASTRKIAGQQFDKHTCTD